MSAARERLGARRPRRRRPVIGYAATVTALKFLLPTIAVALILLVALWPQYLLEGGRFQIVADPTGDEGIDRLSMVKARFQGSDSKNRPFSVSAERAVQDLGDDNLILLAQPKAEMTLENGAWVALWAAEGSYRRDSETLELTGGVGLLHDRGYEIHTSSAAIDLEGGTAEGSDPVDAKGPFGTLQAEGFRIAERGDIVQFTGKSRLVLEGDAEGLP
ncbi:MAG TPA: LPS export ABC transporter periplasmic protein LptC [Alphaproteobacteria bacterium]|nr:LPS export ABC transporter periplasmic protein LptC [Alphaproteobacteria bacterium]